ncbi:cyanophycin synthetase [Pusillimonas sp. ANT_WB101]|uniref:cyanophycin synthetase n=1 Tax=Pusillimonas sp. ANT_WB101 TaxID=2597356 RepID=UPI0011ED9029|nr:cyanophycin synthetase [Pusillimonas sp. ANT_WB101]KAA0892691.1 cyanophycin synthetase [Pusillimonas sp. ANT_WB101]
MQFKTIEFTNMVMLRGPNIWAYRPVIEAWVDIGTLEDFPSNTIPGLYERLVAWLPTLVEHRCSVGERGGFLKRLHDGTWAGHILEHVTLELQSLAGMPGGLGRARETSTRGVYKVIVRAWHEPLTRAALFAARDLVMAAIEDRPFDVDAAVDALRDLVEELRLGPSTTCIVEAADDRDIPTIRLSDANLVQLGYGASQRRIWTAETDKTSAIAESVSRDKDLTKSLLQACGVPVPEGVLVENVDEAWGAALEIGLPVVIKPRDGNHGRGVFTNLMSRQEIETAYAVAVDEGSGVVVERFVRGDEHRILVVGGRMIAAARGDAATVVGDGVNTVHQLIQLQLNSDPRRGSDEDHPLNFIRLDSAATLELARQGLDADSIPPAEMPVLIQRNGNVSIDVTDKVHPSVAAAVELAARVVGLDIAGVDLVAEDISVPLEAQRGAIVEVNAGPGLLMHLKPAAGQPRPVGQAIVNHLFPAGEKGYIPIVGVTGSKGKTTVARIVASLLQLSGKYTGLACSDGLFFGRRHVQKTDAANWSAGRRVLMNRAVQAGVIENGCRSILSEGLAYERCQIGIVTNIDEADLHPDLYVDEPDQLIKVFRTQVDTILPDGVAVLNADDATVVDLAALCDGEVVFFGLNSDSSVLMEHRAAGGRTVFLRDAQIILSQGSNESLLTELTAVPLIADATAQYQICNVLAAVASAWALNISLDLIRAGIEAFDAEPVVASADNVSPALQAYI